MSGVVQAEFQVSGHKYRSERMSAFDQHTVASKLGGILLMMMPNANAKRAKKEEKQPMDAVHFSRAFLVLSADMRKDDMDLIFYLCLKGVSRAVENDQGWAPVLIDGSGAFAFQDINMPELLEIVWHILQQHRIPDFFAEPLSR